MILSEEEKKKLIDKYHTTNLSFCGLLDEFERAVLAKAAEAEYVKAIPTLKQVPVAYIDPDNIVNGVAGGYCTVSANKTGYYTEPLYQHQMLALKQASKS